MKRNSKYGVLSDYWRKKISDTFDVWCVWHGISRCWSISNGLSAKSIEVSADSIFRISHLFCCYQSIDGNSYYYYHHQHHPCILCSKLWKLQLINSILFEWNKQGKQKYEHSSIFYEYFVHPGMIIYYFWLQSN